MLHARMEFKISLIIDKRLNKIKHIYYSIVYYYYLVT